MPAAIDWDALRDECVVRLQALLRLNTVSPPGNETLAAQFLVDLLRAEGIERPRSSRRWAMLRLNSIA